MLQYAIVDEMLVLDHVDSAVEPKSLEELNGVAPVESSFLASAYEHLGLDCKFTGHLLVGSGVTSHEKLAPFFP